MAFKTKALRDYGAISGRCVVKPQRPDHRAGKIDLVAYYRAPVGITGSGDLAGRNTRTSVMLPMWM